MNDFAHLHVHSEYSLLDGLGKTNDLAKEANRLGQSALALTDHGVMHGAIEFFRNCKKNSIKPIIGVEAYMTPYGRPMTGRDAQKDKTRHHLLLLAQNMTGYKNLLKICSQAQLEGFYHKPRIDADFLASHSDGLICTTGCMAAEIPYLLNAEKRQPNEKLALERLQWYLDVFGRERFYVELQEHNIPELSRINKTLFEWSKQHDLGLLVTNDVHYVNAHDAASHDTLLCVQTNSLVTQPNRMKMTDNGYYLKSRAELEFAFQSLTDLPESAFTNSLKIAEMCNIDLEDDKFHLPNLPKGKMPDGFTYETFLRHLTDEGLKIRYGSRFDEPEIQQRKDYELSVIKSMGFDIYYLIVWDLCQYAKSRNIWWNVRGSGAGSIVAYAVGITLIDPLKNGLIFERFLNPGRISMPDFDLDYPDDQREELIRYTVETYGHDHVAQIVAFNRMKAKAVIKDVGRAYNIPLPEVAQINKLIGKCATIDEALEQVQELRDLYNSSPKIKDLIDQSRHLEGVVRHSSIHAAAVIITDNPLTDYIPVMRATGDKIVTKSVAQFEFPICESIGLLKVDFLGLSTLSVMREATQLIEKRHGVKYIIENMEIDNNDWKPLDPRLPDNHLKKAFEIFVSGYTTGVFQVDGQGMSNMLREMRPYQFSHIVAAISLYRPGPMEYIPTYIKRMHNEEETTYRHPKLESILSETYGIIVYQEQIIRIVSELAGYSLGEADDVRKAVSKKIKAKIDAHRIKFIAGCEKNDINSEISQAIWDDIEFFARYGFNKCLVGETQIIDAKTGRLVTLEDLYYKKEKIEKTVTCDTGNLILTSGNISDVLYNGIKPVYRLITALGHEITATANHPFYVFGDIFNEWRQLGLLSIDDLIAVKNNTDYSVAWDKIVSIEYVGERRTYDLTIDKTHNFVANNIIVHNSHASDYGMVTCQTAYLKANYTIEYMAAMFTIEHNNSDKVSQLLSECRSLDIKVLPPSINKSHTSFVIDNEAIRFGLSAIKGVGDSSIEVILTEREANGEFTTLDDFCQRVDLKQVGKKNLESLIKIGALSEFSDDRSLLLAITERMIDLSVHTNKSASTGQLGLFGEIKQTSKTMDSVLDNPPKYTPVKQREFLNWEKELIGTYLNQHPLDNYLTQLKGTNTKIPSDLTSSMNDKVIRVAGIISAIKPHRSKKGDAMAFIEIEDVDTSCEVVIFPQQYAQYSTMITSGNLIIVKGKFEMKEGGNPKILAETITTEIPPMVVAKEKKKALLTLTINCVKYKWDKNKLSQLVDLLKSFKGDDKFRMFVITQNQQEMVDFPNHFTSCSEALLKKLGYLFEDKESLEISYL